MLRSVIAAAAVLMTIPLSDRARGDERSPTLEDIKAAWTARQDNSAAIIIRWKEKRTVSLLGDPRNQPPPNRPPELKQVEIPEQSIVLGAASNHIRYTGEDRDSRLEGHGVSSFISTFDGIMAATYLPPRETSPPPANKYGRGTLDSKFNDSNLFVSPVLMVFRPMASQLYDHVDLSRYQVLKDLEEVDGRKHAVLIQPEGTQFPGLGHRLHLDPAREFLPVKFVETVNGSVRAVFTIRYRKNDAGQWLPESWKAEMRKANGQVLSATEAEVLSLELHTEVSPDHFRLKFPPRTHVSDKRADEEMLIRSDGQIVPFDPRKNPEVFDRAP